MTQFGKVCERLNIVLHTTSAATAKANIERENRTFKDKLIAELRYEKIIDNASSISYNGKYYIPIDLKTGEVTNFQRGTKCILIVNYDGKYISEIENKYYQMMELKSRDSVMKKESEITDSQTKKEHHKYIPPKNHHWR